MATTSSQIEALLPSIENPIQIEQQRIHKIKFYETLEAEALEAELNNKKKPKRLFNRAKYDMLLKEIEVAYSTKGRKTNRQNHLLETYEIYEVGGIKKIISKRTEEDDNIYYLVALEDAWDAINVVHKAVGHKGRDIMGKHARKSYLNLTDSLIDSNLNFLFSLFSFFFIILSANHIFFN